MDAEKTVTVNGKEVTVKMTFGLLNEMCRVCGEIDGAALLLMDNDLRELALITLLSERDAKGKIKKQIDVNEIDMDMDEAVDLLDWAGGHVADFFLKAAERTKGRFEPLQKRVQALMPTSSGSET